MLKFEVCKVFNIWFQRYSDYKIRVCGKNSIPLTSHKPGPRVMGFFSVIFQFSIFPVYSKVEIML